MTSPNQLTAPNHPTLEQQREREAVEASFSFIGVDGVARLRQAQHRLVAAKQNKVKKIKNLERARNDAYAEFDALIDEHLEIADIADGSSGAVGPNRDEYKKILREHSIDVMGDQEWTVGIPDPNTGIREPSGQLKLQQNFDVLVGDMLAHIPNKLPRDPDAELLEARKELDDLREELSSLTAKRMGRLGSRGETKKSFEQLQKDYNEKLAEVSKLEEELRAEKDPSRSEQQKRLDVMTDLLVSEKELRELTNEKLQKTKLAKITTWMNRGSGKVKAMKIIGVSVAMGAAGLVIAATGLGASLAAVSIGSGFVGSTLLNAAVLGALMGRGGVGFLRKNTETQVTINNDDEDAAKELLERIHNFDRKTHDSILDDALDLKGRDLRIDVAEQQKKRRRALSKAGVIAVAGTGVSTLLGLAADSIDKEMMSPKFIEKEWGKDDLTSNGSGHEYGQNETQFDNKSSAGDLHTTDTETTTAQPEASSAPDSGIYPKASAQLQEAKAAETTTHNIEKLDVIKPADVANSESLHTLTTIEPGIGGREYVQNLGFSPDAWNMVQHQMIHDYPDAFYQMSDGSVGFYEGALPNNVAADLFNRLESVNLPGGDSLTKLDVIQPSDINSAALNKLSFIPEDIGSAEAYLRENGLGHTWLELNNPATASELAQAAPDAFRIQNGTLELIPKGRISDEGLAVIANHMNAIERARVGIG